ncbi:PREDICTED: exocyst complex component EXO70B1-like isoform X1 [Camelina sativa]|uniref:Exocyst subunit Exo70 family protein n=1 Tax=Camelina sativa TaxID=90675 RepID=A0ABM0WSI7_CAMSA|nr:PREDICTED: exocyst complex component EXO70B1-like isoform X2 [Camelina sativa]XP_010475544.1 PREDICTED: exocyst complex component EXO70B1-like isoform X1 [Camelina sativa]
MVLLKPSALLKSSKPRQQQQQGFSESLIGDSVEAVDAFITQWVSPHQNDSSSSSSSCILSSLFSAQNRLQGRRFLEVLGRLQYAIQSTVVVNPDSAKLAQGQDLMRKAMKHLEKEFYRVMKSNNRFLDPESVSGWSSESSNTSSTRSSYVNASDSSSSDDNNELDSESSSEFGESDAIVDLKMIANCMISSGYEKDCVKIYKKFRKKIIDDALTRLGFEKLTSTQLQKLEWETLEKKIKTWVRVTTVAITTLFNGERILSDHIFSSVSVAESCFVEITLQSALSLFVFSLTIAKSKKTAEKIFPTLDVYQTILNLIPKIDQIFSYDSTASVRSQAAESLQKLSESVNAMMTEFQTSITKESSKSAIPGGGVHQLTRYVMNFIVFLADYSDSLATILKESSLPLPEDYFSSSGEENPGSGGGRSPMAARLAWLVLVLLCKIDAKSRLYNDSALSYLFLGNNLHYVVTKVRTSNLRIVLGDDWVTNHEVKVSQYLEKYEKKAWGDVIASLPGDKTAEAKAEEALRRFNEAFEEAYKKHKTWVVPDPKLRGEIQASVARKLMPGYTGFYKKYPVGSWKIVRFTPEDLNNYITDLYIGLGRSVPVSKTHKYVVASHAIATTDVKHCSM